MPRKFDLTDYLLPCAMLTGFVLSCCLFEWNTGNAILAGIGYLLISGIAMTLLHRKRVNYEAKSEQAIEGANQRLRELVNSYDAIEQELKTLRIEFDVTEKVKERFLANISHEIRTPMNGIFGMTELLGQTQLNEKQVRYADTIRRSTESLLNIVNDILDFSKIHSGELTLHYSTFSLADLLEDVCSLYAENAQNQGLEIICDVSNISNLNMDGDPTRVRQILNNLVSNAIKFTEHGDVLVSAKLLSDSSQFEISVTDTGIGISPDIQDHIFKEFTQADGSTTRKFGGTGLGLSISSKLASLMNGELKLVSQVGEGSTFSFTCGLTQADSKLATGPLLKTINNIKALVVDDNHTNSAILVQQLELWGIKSTSVDSGSAALQSLQDSLAGNDPFDIAILDLHMPHMDGFELASQIQSNLSYASLQLMMLTSSLTDMSSEELQGIGVSIVLTKPARQAELYGAINNLIENSANRSAQPAEYKPTSPQPSRKPKILLTEDNPINQEVACIMLESIGCEVEVAENGSEAVDALANKQFDLVLMDCQMPVMDGFEATRTIRSQSRQHDIPVVALTANAMEGDREQCIASGMDDYLSKPVNQGELHDAINKWLPQSPVSAESTENSNSTPTEALASMNFEFDESALDAIKALQRPGKPDILSKIVNMYLQKTPELIADIESGVAANDAARVKMAAHTLKSSSAYLGATTLADRCNKLEAKAANDDLTDVATDISEISMGYESICEKITRFT